MRLMALAIVAVGVASAATPAQAQEYNSRYPVCLRAYDIGGERVECGFTSIGQCQMSASGRSAQCFVNPYYGGAPDREGPRGPYRNGN